MITALGLENCVLWTWLAQFWWLMPEFPGPAQGPGTLSLGLCWSPDKRVLISLQLISVPRRQHTWISLKHSWYVGSVTLHDQGLTCYRTSSIPTKPKSRPGLLPAMTGNSHGSHDSAVSFLMEVKYTVFRVSPSHRRTWHVLHKPSFKCWSLIQLACTGQTINKLRQVKPMSAALQQDSGSWPMTCLEEQLLSVVPRSLAEPLWGAVWECSGTEGKAAVIFLGQSTPQYKGAQFGENPHLPPRNTMRPQQGEKSVGAEGILPPSFDCPHTFLRTALLRLPEAQSFLVV